MADDRKPDDKAPNDQNPGEDRPPPVSAAEWATAAVGLALVLLVVGQLVREAAGGSQRPPDVTVRADSVARGRGGWLVFYTARNGGDATASALTVRATLARPGGGGPAEREAEIDYLPARSERRGGFFFAEDPRAAGALRLEAVGYEEP